MDSPLFLLQVAPACGPSVQRRIWDDAVTTADESVMVTMLGWQMLAPGIEAEARLSRLIRVRIAWIERQGRSDDELAEFARTERHGDVLAALVRTTGSVDLVRRVLGSGKRPVVRAVLERDNLPSDVYAQACSACDGWIDQAPLVLQEKARSRVESIGDEIAQLSRGWDSITLMTAAVRLGTADGEVLAHQAETLVSHLSAGPFGWHFRSWITRAFEVVAVNRHTPVESLRVLREGLVTYRNVVAQASERRLIDEIGEALGRYDDLAGYDSEAALCAALAHGSAEWVAEVWQSLAGGAVRPATAAAAWSNPDAPGAVLVDVLRHDPGYWAQAAGRLDDSALALLAAYGGPIDPGDILAMADDPDAVVHAALVHPEGHGSPFAERIDLVGRAVLGGLPWPVLRKYLNLSGAPCLLGVAVTAVADALAGHEGGWRLFCQIESQWSGTLDGLIDTCVAATQ